MNEEKLKESNDKEIILVKNKHLSQNNKSLFVHSKINIWTFYWFLTKSYIKGWYIWLIITMFVCPIGLSLLFCSISLTNQNIKNYYFFGMGIIFLINSFVISSLVIFHFFGYWKFTDVQNRFGLLNLKNLGYLLILFLSVFTYVVIANFITLSIFTIFMISEHIKFFSVYSWPLLFYLIYSFLLTSFFVTIQKLILLYMKSFKTIIIFSELFILIPLAICYIFFILYPKITNHINLGLIYLSAKSVLYYFSFGITLLFINFCTICLFAKQFSFKR